MSNWNTFDEQNQLTFKRPDLGRWLGRGKITDNKDILLHYKCPRLEILNDSLTGARSGILGGEKIVHNIFITFYGSIEMAAHFNNLKTIWRKWRSNTNKNKMQHLCCLTIICRSLSIKMIDCWVKFMPKNCK